MPATSSIHSLQPLSELKDTIIAALRRLKRGASQLGSLKGVPKDLALRIDAESINLAEYWQSLEEQSGRPMVTMVGMVNAGKSALGNILLQVGESGVFREGVTRETSEAKSADAGVMRLTDLPGLGSAVAEEDDPVVRRYIRRASVVLIIIGVDAPIPEHLYKFLEEEIEPTQRVVIIMNKVDIFDGYPDSYRDNALDEYKEFLLNGNPRLGFPGVRHFFSYEVPIVIFSVHHARSQNNPSYVEPLLTAISSSIDLSSETTMARTRTELLKVCERFEPLNDAWRFTEKSLSIARSQFGFLDSKYRELFETEASTFLRSIREIDNACWKTMNRQPEPSWFEKTFETSGLSDKKISLREIRDSSCKQMHHAEAAYFSQLRKGMTDMARAIMPDFVLSSVTTEEIYAILDQIAYANWDVWDDYYFRDKPSSLHTINERTSAKLAELINGLEKHYQGITFIHNAESRIRLVDVPGIGGVAHANETLAPFVNMADCVIFVLNAHGDITNDDVKFLRDHVAAIESASEGQSLPSAERGAEKRVLVVINKWESAIGWKSRQDAESAFDSKRDWILHGRSDLGFKGIACHFDKAPEVVRAETNVRDPKTGMPIITSKGNDLGLTEVITALRNVLAEDGVDFRLNRPRLATIRSIRTVKSILNDEQTIGALKLLQKQFAVLGQRTELAAVKVQQDLDDRLATVEEKLKYFISSRLKQVIHSWKPSVPFLEGLRGAVPEWFGWAGKVGLGKTQMQANLRVEWEEQLRPLIEQGLPAQELSNLLQKEADAIKRLVTSTFQMNLIDNPDLLEKLPGLSDRFSAGEGKIDVLDSLKRDLDEAISKVQTGLMDDILGLLAWDMISAAIVGLFLTPAASALLVAYRRWKRGEKKGDETRQELDGAIDKVAEQIAINTGADIGKRFQERVTEVSAKIGRLIGEQQSSASGPLKIVEDIVQRLDGLLIELDQLQGTQPTT